MPLDGVSEATDAVARATVPVGLADAGADAVGVSPPEEQPVAATAMQTAIGANRRSFVVRPIPDCGWLRRIMRIPLSEGTRVHLDGGRGSVYGELRPEAEFGVSLDYVAADDRSVRGIHEQADHPDVVRRVT